MCETQNSPTTPECLVGSRRTRRPPHLVRMEDLVEGRGKRGPKPKGFVERFWSNVEKRGPDECWPWTGGVQTAGYGIMCVGTLGGNLRRWLSHRLSYLIHHGELDDSVLVCHHCDNPPCCNPKHLFIGDHSDNIRDASSKGRLQRPRPYAAKLTETEVLEIKKKHSQGQSRRSLAREYRVDPHTVFAILRGITWCDITI